MIHAVIDLGTNTCNLLIAEIREQSYRILHQGKEGVKLGNEGFNRNILTPEAFQRAVLALKKHREIINRYTAGEVTVVATSAVRDATNRDEFKTFLLHETGLPLTVVSGEEEARFIFNGVRLAFGALPGRTLISDIGGGSNEFIYVEDGNPVWKESFPTGMARLITRIPISDPIADDEIEAIETWLTEGMKRLWERLRDMVPERLIGCAGAFDSLADLLDRTVPGTTFRVTREITMPEFNRICDKLIRSTAAERENMVGMDPLRTEMIVPSTIMIRLILEKLHIRRIVQTGFSLCEGILYSKIYPYL